MEESGIKFQCGKIEAEVKVGDWQNATIEIVKSPYSFQDRAFKKARYRIIRAAREAINEFEGEKKTILHWKILHPSLGIIKIQKHY